MPESSRTQVLREAEFSPRVRTYWLLSGALLLTVTVAGILLLPVWFAVGHALTGRYLRHMRCVLTKRTLQFSKGMFVRVEKTVPLDKITDLGLTHGPVMRYFGLRTLTVETAGQSAQGPLVKLIGIVDTEAFREAVLAQRDAVVESFDSGQPPTERPAADAPSAVALLTEIRDTLLRVERRRAGE